jgi:hypothetical protein
LENFSGGFFFFAIKSLNIQSMAFPKGVSPNPGGKPKTKDWTEAIMIALTRKTGADRKEALAKLALKLVDAAYDKGDLVALKEIGDRVEGKPSQAVEHSGEITHTHEQALNNLERDPAALGEGAHTTH